MTKIIYSYGKTKEAFGWPEETEEVTSVSNNAPTNQSYNMESEPLTVANTIPITNLEKLTTGILEVLDGTFTLYPLYTFKAQTIKTATKLLTMPTPPSIQMYSKSLLSALHPSRQAYHSYKDQALLQHVLENLNTMIDAAENKNIKDIDAESFYRLVLIVRGIAVSRPQNLIKFTDSHTSIQDVVLDDPLGKSNFFVR